MRVSVVPLMEDLCRRGVFRESDGLYKPAVGLFAIWLTETGFARLVSDQLGDELAEARRQREDAAYVQASEIVDLTQESGTISGPEYYGRRCAGLAGAGGVACRAENAVQVAAERTFCS